MEVKTDDAGLAVFEGQHQREDDAWVVREGKNPSRFARKFVTHFCHFVTQFCIPEKLVPTGDN